MLADPEEASIISTELSSVIKNTQIFNALKKEKARELFSSDVEMDLDIPTRSMTSKIFYSSSEQEASDKENMIDGTPEDVDVESSDDVESGNDRTVITKIKTKKQRFLSREFILNSDTDEDENESESEFEKLLILNDNQNEIDDKKDGRKIKKKIPTRNNSQSKFKQKEDHSSLKRPSHNTLTDFNETLKRINFEDFSSDDSSNEIKETKIETESTTKNISKKKIKKPTDTLKKTLTEAETLIRAEMEEINLNIEVTKFKDLSVVLNEALAFNSKTPADSRKKVIEAARSQQRKKLEKFLGSERMKELSVDDPKIGFEGLDETLEIQFKTAPVDDKGDSYEKMNFKLIDLPSKHFDKKSSRNSNNERASYMTHLPVYKKASIEILNAQLQDKINLQSQALLLNHQLQAKARAIAAKKSKLEAQEKSQHKIAVKREKELKELRDKKVSGGELFKKKYDGIERPEMVRNRPLIFVENESESQICNETETEIKLNDIIKNDESGLYELTGLNETTGLDEKVKAKSRRIILSDESESGSDSDSDCGSLLNLDSESEDDNENNILPDMNEAINTNVEFGEFDELLSGCFEGNESKLSIKNNKEKSAIKVEIIKNVRKRSEFLDDEASDEEENEERESEMFDEEALDKEMKESKFIAEDTDTEFDDEHEQHDLNAYRANQNIKEDTELIQRLKERFGGHLGTEIGEDGRDLGKLGEKYGFGFGLGGNTSLYPSSNCTNTNSNTFELDEDIKKLLDPLEQKKKKLSALGSINLLERKRIYEAATDEFVFKEELKHRHSRAINKEKKNKDWTDVESDHFDHHTGLNQNFDSESSDYYGSSDLDNDSDRNSDDFDSDPGKEKENDYYERIESGLQSKVGEMLDVESLDVEEVQVQASESLRKHLDSFGEPVKDSYREHPVNNNIHSNRINSKANKGMVVPIDAKMRSRLIALECQDDSGDNYNHNNNPYSNNNNQQKKPFKGFVKM